jgi:hypothetical protein
LGFSNWPVIFASSTNANKLSGTIIKFFGALPRIEVEEAPTSTRPHQCHEPGLKASSNEPLLPRQLRRMVADRFRKSLRN